MANHPPTLEYAARSTSSSIEERPHRHVRLIYGIGVFMLFAFQFCEWASWPHTSNGADPRKAEIFMAMHVAGGAALVWLILGLRRIFVSPFLRRDAIVWLLVVGNVLAAFPILMDAYQ